MTNFKNKILQATQNGKNLETTLNDLSTIKENLLKNHSNPVFSNKDKNKILKKYTDLQNIDKSLNRYKTLKQNNYLSDAEEEKTNIENVVLEGGISYNKYIWHSENDKHTCDECRALDGKVFDFYDEVPERLHPNCKCNVEIVQDIDIEIEPQDNLEEGEPCDCFDDVFDEIDKLIGDGKRLQDEILVGHNNLSDYLTKKYIEPVKSTLINCIDVLEQIFGTVGDFIRNYNDMKEANTIGADKYFHSKANCDGSQRGELGAEVAKGMSDLREYTDSFKNVYLKGMTEAESAKDSAEDQAANEYGRQQGRNNTGGYCGDMVDIFRPKGLPPRY